MPKIIKNREIIPIETKYGNASNLLNPNIKKLMIKMIALIKDKNNPCFDVTSSNLLPFSVL
ncbi:MAG: hypothetical protein ACTSRG_23590 [Candidatus Helarchaeota archaeon]